MDKDRIETRFLQIMDVVSADEQKNTISHEDFVKRAILKLRDTSKSRGIHSGFSGFNSGFRLYYGGEDPVEAVRELEREGRIQTRLAKRGAMLYLPGEAPDWKYGDGASTLKRILDD